MSYREPLPDGCPPDEAEEIVEQREVFRLVRNRAPTEEDFRSQRAERPDTYFTESTSARRVGYRFMASVTTRSVHGSSPTSVAASSVWCDWRLVRVASSRPGCLPITLGGHGQILIF